MLCRLCAVVLAFCVAGEAAFAQVEVKVLGRAVLGGNVMVGKKDDGVRLVIRSDKDAAAIGGQKTLEALARQMKVEAIDLDKRMLIHVTAGTKPTGGFRVEITKLERVGRVLTVHWKLHTPTGFVTQAFTHPGEIVLVEKHLGDVLFKQAK